MIRRSAIAGDQVAVLQRAALQDERLSFRARGILASVLSRPLNWQTDAEKLAKETPSEIDGKRGEGIKSVYAALNELARYGYLKRTRYQDERGRWKTDWDLSDDPVTTLPVDNSAVDNLGDDDVSAGHTDRPLRTVGKPTVGGPTVGQPMLGGGPVKEGSRDRVLEKDLVPPSTGTSPGAEVVHSAAAEPTDKPERHPHELNARRAIGTLLRDTGLPMDVAEILRSAYRIGAGDPWLGYLAMKPTLIATYPGARDIVAVIKSEIAQIEPFRNHGGASA